MFNITVMKIHALGGLRTALGVVLTAGAIATATPQTKPQNINTQPVEDVYVNRGDLVPAKGTSDPAILQDAPSPVVFVKDEAKKAKMVVQLSTNVLYKYDDNGQPEIAYRIASGKKSTPTDTGISIVSHVESYPYRTASPKTKRYKNPRDYGPKAIILEKLNPVTGMKRPTGEFIHGNNNKSSIGKYASKGCMRMDNQVIKILANQVQRGDLVLIIP